MTMTRDQITDYVRRLTYKPDWSFDVDTGAFARSTHRSVRVVIKWDVRDSGPHNAPDYRRHLAAPFARSVWVDCDDCPTEMHVARAVLEACVEMELGSLFHEGREFLRVRTLHDGWAGEEWFAPFHPHTLHGADMWEATNSMQLEGNKMLDQG